MSLWRNLDDSGFRRFDDRVDVAVREGLEKNGERMLRTARRLARTRRDTGAMDAGFYIERPFRVSHEVWRVRIGNREFYSVFQSLGTRHIRGARFFQKAVKSGKRGLVSAIRKEFRARSGIVT